MKIRYFCLTGCLLGASLLAGHAAFSQASGAPPAAKAPVPLANNVADDNRVSDKPFAEERMAAQNFIESVNEARRELAMKQVGLARQKIIMARGLLPLIARASPADRRLTRVEFGGGLYSDDLDQRKSYSPIETISLENLTRATGPRWTKNTRSESDAQIIYVALDLSDGKAQEYLDQAEKDVAVGSIREAGAKLAELSDRIIRVDDGVPAAIQARDYITLADNYISVGNFFGAKKSLERGNGFLNKMKNEDIYKPHHSDIIALHKDIEELQTAFAKLDAEQIKNAGANLKKWEQQLASWAGE